MRVAISVSFAVCPFPVNPIYRSLSLALPKISYFYRKLKNNWLNDDSILGLYYLLGVAWDLLGKVTI